jgi:hypothetical protein
MSNNNPENMLPTPATESDDLKITLSEMVRSYRKAALNTSVPSMPADFAQRIAQFEKMLEAFIQSRPEYASLGVIDQVIAFLRHAYQQDAKNAKFGRFYAEAYLDIKGFGSILYYSFELALDGIISSPVTEETVNKNLIRCREAILTALEPLIGMSVVSEPAFYEVAGLNLAQMAQLVHFCENDAIFSKHAVFQQLKKATKN